MSLVDTLAARALAAIDPEQAHLLALRALQAGFGGRDRSAPDPILATTLAGIALPNPIGLAAGFDKDAVAPAALLRAGFGFVECGTTTPRPQAGNPRPRLFRLREDGAVINRMGFNNAGVEAFAEGLADAENGVVGANIGANKDSADRIADYQLGLTRLWGLCDYFTLNVSSPNTPGLRELQGRAALDEMLGRIAETPREPGRRWQDLSDLPESGARPTRQRCRGHHRSGGAAWPERPDRRQHHARATGKPARPGQIRKRRPVGRPANGRLDKTFSAGFSRFRRAACP